MSNKIFSAPLQVKSAIEGTVEAVFATLEHWDLDNDFTSKGAFGSQGNIILEGWNHSDGLPCGEGRIFERDGKAVFSGQFFMDTVNGRDHFQVVRKRADRQEFSYTFNIQKAEKATHAGRPGRFLQQLEVIGVSPVTRGAAGPGMTGVQSIKSQAGRVWMPIGRRRTDSEVAAALSDAKMRWVRLQVGDLAKSVKSEPTPAEITEATWLINAQAEGYSREYSETVLAIRRNARAQWQQHFEAQGYLPHHAAQLAAQF